MNRLNTEIVKAAKKQREKILTDKGNRPNPSEVRKQRIPEELKDCRRWVCWKWAWKGRWTKKPVKPDGSAASSTDPNTWGSFADAHIAWQCGKVSGIGFVLGDGWAGIDADNCICDGEIAPSAKQVIHDIDSYTEVSPTGTGLKILVQGKKPEAFTTAEGLDVYDDSRYFTITGRAYNGSPNVVRQLDDWSTLQPPEDRESEDFRHALNSMRKIPVPSAEMDGSGRLIKYARQAVRCGLDDGESLDAIRQMLDERPTERDWSDDEILQRITDAQKRQNGRHKALRLTLADLVEQNPKRSPELIEGFLRRGELMTFIAASKEGKSWMSYGMAMAIARGEPWLGYPTKKGRVLIIDNELQPSELAFRLSTVANSLVVDPSELEDRLIVEPLRGSWPNIHAIDELLRVNYSDIEIDLIIVDAYYRSLPPGISENDNAAVTAIFNQLDNIAKRHGCSMAMVHHASKGDQTGKSITDIGSGAGAMTRAADTHIVLRPHEEDGLAVMEAVCRSHVAPEPKTLRFDFPLWKKEDSIQPKLKVPESAAERKQQNRDAEAEAKVLEVLTEEVEATVGDIRKHVGMGYDRTNRILHKLEKHGRVQVTKEIIKRGNTVQLWAILEPLNGVHT